jgi:hypothetical protein
VLRVPASRLTGYHAPVIEHLVLQIRAYLAAEVKKG